MNRVLKNLTRSMQKAAPPLAAPKGKRTPLTGGGLIPDFAALVKSSMDLGQVKLEKVSRSTHTPPEIRLISNSKILAFTQSASSPLHSEPSRIHTLPEIRLNLNSEIFTFTQSASSLLHSEPSRIHPSLEPETHHLPIAENRSTGERSTPSEFMHPFAEKPAIAAPESAQVHAPVKEPAMINERAIPPSPVDPISGNQSFGVHRETHGGRTELNEIRLPDASTISVHSHHSSESLSAILSDRLSGHVEIQTVMPAEPRSITPDFKPVATPILENETTSPQTNPSVMTEGSGDNSEDTGEGMAEAFRDIEFTTEKAAISSFTATFSAEEGSSSETIDFNGLEATESSPEMESTESEPGSHSLVEAGLSEGGKSSGQSSVKLETPTGGSTTSPSPAFFVLRKSSSGRGSARAQQRAGAPVGVSVPQTKSHRRLSHSSSLRQSTPVASAPKSPVLAPESKSAQTHAPSPSPEEKLTKLLDVKALAEKIMARARLTNNEVKALEIRLNPPHLGLLRLQVVTQGEEMRLWVTADRPEMAPVLKEAHPELVKVVAEQGYNLVQCEVENHDLHSRWPEEYPSSGTKSPRELWDSSTGDSTREAPEEGELLPPLNFGYNTLDLVA